VGIFLLKTRLKKLNTNILAIAEGVAKPFAKHGQAQSPMLTRSLIIQGS
jgi:flagellar basal body P-ring protein FlgI